jgi:predicted membrane-bound spermidine synthase
MIWYFLFFLVSGFCSILYELIWLRLAMAQFGVTTPLVSIVLSMFMAGIGLGSWAAGHFARTLERRQNVQPLKLYALCEMLIGVSALLVPLQLSLGHRFIEVVSGSSGISSGVYYLISVFCLALTLIPWCGCMGATIPLAMLAIRRDRPNDSQHSFSFLYVANLVGAIAGATVPLLLIELAGFRGTLRVGMLLNFLIAASAFILATRRMPSHLDATATPQEPARSTHTRSRRLLLLLFLTGLTSMGAEVVWIRLFTPSIGPMVYSFALILASYLVATFLGSRIYRWWSRKNLQEDEVLWVFLSFLGLLPLLAADVRLPLTGVLRVLIGVMPFSAAVGFLTPMLVDRWSQGEPAGAGRAYAVNVLGCISGPLLSGFLLLPLVGERFALLILMAPFFLMTAISISGARKVHASDRAARYAIAAAALLLFALAKDLEAILPHRVVLRDSTATVIGAEFDGPKQKALLVNGINMTGLTTITKYMAHLTLASHEHPPQNALVICFGMGTTFRSSLSWGIPTTVVDLIPSVPKMFSYFHGDAARVLAEPGAQVIVDDGRRFLERTPETFDAIIVDPPPPVHAAGSSLLYSKEFYVLVKRHLRYGGIFQQWLPEGDAATQAAVARALKEAFPYVRIFGYSDAQGMHFLASMTPLPVRSPDELAARVPPSAAADLIEWGPSTTAAKQFAALIPDPVTLDALIARSSDTPALQDDRPINEYYLLRAPCPRCPRGVEFVRLWLYSRSGIASTSGLAATRP